MLDLFDDPVSGAAAVVGPSSIGMKNFVARTMPRRDALQGITDDLLRYAAGVDVGGLDEVDPGVEGVWMTLMASARSSLPHGPNIIVPRHSGLTATPVRPSSR